MHDIKLFDPQDQSYEDYAKTVADKIIAANPDLKVITTIGIYCDDSYKVNGVDPKLLASHIWYNIIYRPGRAFIVNGIPINQGYLKLEKLAEWVTKLADIHAKELSRKYH